MSDSHMEAVSLVSLPSSQRADAGADFVSELFDSRPESTLLGAGIGAVHDFIDAPENAEEKLKRAESHDFAAHVAADTVAMVPKFKLVTAGLARSTMLVNPHDGLNQDLSSFALNAAEGAALNGVGRSMLPGSSLHRAIGTKLGRGLMAETATHISAGFGFGAIKSGFRPESWTAEDGSLSVTQGLETVLKTGAVAATVNLPAGYVGFRAAKYTGAALASGRMSAQRGALLVGTTSGYSSGAVIGAIEGVRDGKSISETLELMNTSGLIGLTTGVAFVGALPGRSRVMELSANHAEAFGAPESLVPGGEAAALTGKNSRYVREQHGPDTRRLKMTDLESLEIRVNDNQPLSELSGRLTRPQRTTRSSLIFEGGEFTNADEFFALTRFENETVRVYGVSGHETRIIVPERHARGMETTRRQRLAHISEMERLRSIADREIPFDSMSREVRSSISSKWADAPDRLAMLKQHMSDADAIASLEVIDARTRISRGSITQDALPEDIVALLDELPNSRLVKEVVISDRPNPRDALQRKLYDPDFESAASANEEGVITFYKPTVAVAERVSRYDIRDVMNHEWSHESSFTNREHLDLLQLATRVDKDVPVSETADLHSSELLAGTRDTRVTDKYYSRTYGRKDLDENWAVHMGEEFMAPDADRFFTLAEMAPVRTAVFAKDMAASLGSRSANGKAFANRMMYVQEQVLPEAVKLLEHRIATGTPGEQAAALELLGVFGTAERHTGPLLKTASGSRSGLVPETGEVLPQRQSISMGPSPRLSGRTIGDIAFDAAHKLNTHPMSRDGGVEFLVQHGRQTSPVRELAVDRLSGVRDGQHYIRFLELAGDSDMMIPLMDLLPGMRTRHGQSVVFDEIMALSSNEAHGSKFQASFMREALRRYPNLRMTVMERMTVEQAAQAKDILWGVSHSEPNAQVAARAGELLKMVNNESTVESAIGLMGNSDQVKVLQGVEMSRQVHDSRLVQPLLDVVAHGPASAQQPALNVLMGYNPQVVKYYLRADRTGLNFDTLLHLPKGS